MADEETGTVDGARTGGKFLTFGLGQEDYAISILKVQEIIGMMDVTMVPRMPPCVRGVINLRGKIVPVIDLRTKFEMPRVDLTEETCIIVVDGLAGEMGIIVDRVSEVLDIAAREIEPPPVFGAALNTDYLLGIGKSGGRVQLVLDIERVLSAREAARAAAAASAETTDDAANQETGNVR
ncbi:MAG: purine-binding chemotaxis protein CheW [Myxococcales bacterium]|nr:purine-binding chemotaxis protein CheW [Myxococcales bacterium]